MKDLEIRDINQRASGHNCKPYSPRLHLGGNRLRFMDEVKSETEDNFGIFRLLV